jgi:glycine/D-amino acid oxidase-like deaminating enzyme/nitrite reductase/ring-hydroxylating ferredoxin subunit
MKLSGRSRSIWLAGAPAQRADKPAAYEPLSGNAEADVAILGAGITGLTAALQLVAAGRSVIVLERDRVGTGETGYTTAHLTQVLDIRYKEIEGKFGKDAARLVAESKRTAIDEIGQIAATLRIACAYERVDGYLYSEAPAEVGMLEEETEAARRAGLEAEIARSVPLPFRTAAGMRVRNQAQIHPIVFVRGIAAYLSQHGTRIHERTVAREVHDGEPCRVVTDSGELRARDVIVAAHVPISNRVLLHTKIAAYRSYLIAARVKRGTAPAGLFWDTQTPYHYIRSHSTTHTTYVIVGGEDHKTGGEAETEERYLRLDEYTRARLDVERISYRWSGQIIEPVDGLPYIGRNAMSSHLHVATGYSGNGMTFGALAGSMLADQILGRPNKYSKLYAATRVTPVASAADYLTENLDFPRYLIVDRLTSADVNDLNPESLQSGEGAIFKLNGEKVAACRDEEGRLHLLSPVCTHLGCDVRWNRAEQTWDCPCHGSRFAPDGRVINGPATADLAPKQLAKPAGTRH